MINKDGWLYNGSQTYVKDAAIWLKNQQYKNIFLFGFSGGGVVVAYEIQKDYASTLYSATIVAAAPVDWDEHSGIYRSAHTAYKVKVTTCCICGETDVFSRNKPDLRFCEKSESSSLHWGRYPLGFVYVRSSC